MSLSKKRQLIVEVGDWLFAIDAAVVREVVEPLPTTPVPGAVPEVIGLINLRGDVMLAVRLGGLLDVESRAGWESAFVVVEGEAERLALQVDRLIDVARYSSTDLDIEGEQLAALGACEVVSGVGRYGDRPYYRLDIARILERVLEPAGNPGLPAGAGSTGRQVQG